MNRNVNVFIAVLLCALLCGGVVWLRMASEEKLGLNVQDTYDASSAYSSGSSYADATFVGPSSGGMMSVTSSRRSMRTRATSSYAGAYSSAATQPLTSHLSPLTSHLSPLTSHLSPLTSSPTGGGLYTTSSQTFKSFGGGNNAGVSMSGGSLVTTNNYAQTSSAVSISSPISLISTSLPNSDIAYPVNDNGYNEGSAVMASSPMLGGAPFSVYGGIYTTPMEQSVGPYAGIPRGKKMYAPTISGQYQGWLDEQKANGGDGYDYGYDKYELWDLFQYYFPPGSFGNDEEEWAAWVAFLNWFMSTYPESGKGGGSWYFVPMFDAIPFLLILSALWALVRFSYLRKKRLVKLTK